MDANKKTCFCFRCRSEALGRSQQGVPPEYGAYEHSKAELNELGLTDEEYERRVRELAGNSGV